MFAKFVSVKEAEGTLLVLDTSVNLFKFMYNNVEGEPKVLTDHYDICDEIDYWGYNSVNDFMASNVPVETHGHIFIYWCEA
jgi:hypothetical protein